MGCGASATEGNVPVQAQPSANVNSQQLKSANTNN